MITQLYIFKSAEKIYAPLAETGRKITIFFMLRLKPDVTLILRESK